MEPILTDTLRFRVTRLIDQRNLYRKQRDGLANAIGHHRSCHLGDAHEADSELWSAYVREMGLEPGVSGRLHNVS